MRGATDNLLRSTSTIDLKYWARDRYIACCVLECEREVALLDPGPSITINKLRLDLKEKGIGISDVGTILLTHVHLDHAGVTGSLLKENPRIRVYVHERGAKHLIDPRRLLESASRTLGARADETWGPFFPVPSHNLHVVKGGEEITVENRSFEVLYTPGHAVHHVSYFEQASEVAFAGDAAGVRITDSFVYPATPPPDIDLVKIDESLNLIEARKPQHLFLTHFGLVNKVEWHIAEFRKRLRRWSEYVRLSLEEGGDDLQLAMNFTDMVRKELSLAVTAEEASWFDRSISSRQNWHGLARYWRNQRSRLADAEG